MVECFLMFLVVAPRFSQKRERRAVVILPVLEVLAYQTGV